MLLNVFYRHSRIKQYLKDGRAMRIETVINHTRDLGCNARLPNLDDLQTKARACNRRILDAQRVGQGCQIVARRLGCQLPVAKIGAGQIGAGRCDDQRRLRARSP